MSETLRNILIKYGVDLSQYTTQTAKLKSEQTKIENSFRQTTNAMDDWQSTSLGLSARVSALSDKIKLQKDVLKNLQAEYNAISTAAGEDSAATQNLQKQYNRASDELDRMNKQLSDYKEKLYNAATAEGKTAKEAQEMGGQLKRTETQTKGFKDTIKEFATSAIGQFASISGAVTFVVQQVKSLWENLRNAAGAADDLATLSNQTGITTDNLQELAYASRFVDVEVETMQKGLSRVVMAVNEAKKSGNDYIETAGGLKISLNDINGNLKDSEELFYNAIDAIGGLANETEREAAAQDIFGRSYQELMPLIKEGSKGLRKYGDEAENTGIVVDRVAVAALNRLNDEIDKTDALSTAASQKLSAMLAPAAIEAEKASRELDNLFPKAILASEYTMAAISDFTKGQFDIQSSISKWNSQMSISQAYTASGIATTEEFNQKGQELINFYESKGIPTLAAYAMAVTNLAEKTDLAALRTQLAAEKQAELDLATTSSLENYKTKNAEYLAEIKKDADGFISNIGNVFDEFKTNTEVTGDTLLKNMKSNEAGMATWATNIDALAKRGIDEGLLESLRKMGPSAAGEIEALNSLSDPKLKEYVSSWKNMSDTATMEAEKANADMKYQVLKSLDEMKYAIEDKDAGMSDVAKELGLGITDGMIDGLDSSKINNKIANMARDALAVARRELEEHSPSKKFAEVGKNVSLGMAVGIESGLPDVLEGMSSMTDKMMNVDFSIPKMPKIENSFAQFASSAISTNTTNIKKTSGDVYINFTEPVNIANDYDVDRLAKKLGNLINDERLAHGE